MAATMLCAAGHAAPVLTYTGSQQIGDIAGTYSITTGKTGSIGIGDIAGFSFTLSSPTTASYTLDAGNSIRHVAGGPPGQSIFSATQQALNFSGNGGAGVAFTLYGADGDSQAEVIVTGAGTVSFSIGNDVQQATLSSPFAIVGGDAPSPTPEPATWAMMIMGLGAVGTALRGRRPTVRFA